MAKIKDTHTGRFLSVNKIIKRCLYCKKEFGVPPCLINKKYCSRECWKKRSPEIELKCAHCGKIFHRWKGHTKGRKNYYCSKICWESRSPKINIHCDECGKEFYEWKGNLNKHNYCSRECRIKNLRGEKHPNWKGGFKIAKYTYEFQIKKKKIRLRDGNKCILCSLYSFNSNNYPFLDIHHIDFNKQNNKDENLITLCHSHHSQTKKNRMIWQELFKKIIPRR